MQSPIPMATHVPRPSAASPCTSPLRARRSLIPPSRHATRPATRLLHSMTPSTWRGERLKAWAVSLAACNPRPPESSSASRELFASSPAPPRQYTHYIRNPFSTHPLRFMASKSWMTLRRRCITFFSHFLQAADQPCEPLAAPGQSGWYSQACGFRVWSWVQGK